MCVIGCFDIYSEMITTGIEIGISITDVTHIDAFFVMVWTPKIYRLKFFLL